MCYEGAVDLDSIKDLNRRHALEVQIMEFGQIPKQIFTVPHPQRILKPVLYREPSTESIEEKSDDDKKNIWSQLKNLELQTTFSSHKDVISSLLISVGDKNIISVGHDSLLKVFSIENNRQIRSASIGSMPLSSCLQLPNKNILIVGSYDNNIIFYDLDFGRIMHTLLAHDDAVSCLAWGNTKQLLASGSWDCSIQLWFGLTKTCQIKQFQNVFAKFEHDSHVTCLAFNR